MVEVPDVTWADIGGLEEVKRELQEASTFCFLGRVDLLHVLHNMVGRVPCCMFLSKFVVPHTVILIVQ